MSSRRARSFEQRIIMSEADIADGVRALQRLCPHMKLIAARVGQPPLRRYPPDLRGLARIIVGQQLSTASAEAIWKRTETLVGPFTARRLLAHDETSLRSAGLSAAKIRTLHALARAAADGLDVADLVHASDDDVRASLTAVHGIGPWTADIFLLFCLGRADAWASGDLALQLAARDVLGLKERPAASELDVHAERWRPWRGVAARLLWADYGLRKAQKSGAPV